MNRAARQHERRRWRAFSGRRGSRGKGKARSGLGNRRETARRWRVLPPGNTHAGEGTRGRADTFLLAITGGCRSVFASMCTVDGKKGEKQERAQGLPAVGQWPNLASRRRESHRRSQGEEEERKLGLGLGESCRRLVLSRRDLRSTLG
jgi:hypothetical protein